ncbi:MAG: hypothetical protein WBE49_03110, partial [Methylovirgula sp.]
NSRRLAFECYTILKSGKEFAAAPAHTLLKKHALQDSRESAAFLLRVCSKDAILMGRLVGGPMP